LGCELGNKGIQLATPLTILLKIKFENIEETQYFGLMHGKESSLERYEKRLESYLSVVCIIPNLYLMFYFFFEQNISQKKMETISNIVNNFLTTSNSILLFIEIITYFFKQFFPIE